MPKTTTGGSGKAPSSGPKGELLGKNETLRASTIAAMPGQRAVNEKAQHPHVTINGVTYAWEPGQEEGIPDEALAVWARYLEANP